MRNDLRLLLGLADPVRPLTAERVGSLLTGSPAAAVEAVPALAARHRVDGFIGARLGALPAAAVPRDLREPLVRALHRNKVRAHAALHERNRILDALARRDIRWIVLKGADLAFRVYPDPGARPFDDIDLLVHEPDLSDAAGALRELGYETPRGLLPEPALRKIHFHLPFVHENGQFFVEVHWHLADRHTLDPATLEGAWQDAVETPGGGWTLSPDTYAAYLAVHLAKHGVFNHRIEHHERAVEVLLHPWADCRLIWLIDLWMLAQHSGLDPARIAYAADRLGCRQATDQALRLVGRVFPECPWELPAAPPPAAPGRVEHTVTSRYLRGILADLDREVLAADDAPWMLTVNKRLHIRPIRLFSRRGTYA